MASQVQAFDPPRVISRKPGQDTDDGGLTFPGWIWRYDLTHLAVVSSGSQRFPLALSTARFPRAPCVIQHRERFHLNGSLGPCKYAALFDIM